MSKKSSSLAGELKLLLIALITGVGTGVIAIAFRFSVHSLENLRGMWQQEIGSWAWILRFLGPVAGCTLVGWVVYRVVRVRVGHGVPVVIQSVVEDKPLDDPQMALMGCSAAVILGSGGSAGPEGPIVELGAVAGSYARRWGRLPREAVQTMIGCGAAAGIAAIFNAPLGGVLFVMEVVLRDFRMRTLAPVIVASVAASAVNEGAFGIEPAIHAPAISKEGSRLLLVTPVVALLCACVSVAFIELCERLSRRVNAWRIPSWCKPMLGGVVIGAIGVFLPDVQGIGYGLAEEVMGDSLPWSLLTLLLIAKVLGTVVTLSSGAPGGAFAPALAIGAIAGALVAGPFGLGPAAAGLMGMAGMVAGAFQAPLSAVVITMRIGHYNPDLMVPLMCTSALSSWTVNQWVQGNIYDVNLLRRGMNLHLTRSVKVLLAERSAREVMEPDVITFSPNLSLGAILDIVSDSDQESFPVVDERGEMTGVVTMDIVRQTLRTGELGGLILACDLASPAPPTVTPDTSLTDVWHLFRKTHMKEVFVTESGRSASNGTRFVGRISQGAVL